MNLMIVRSLKLIALASIGCVGVVIAALLIFSAVSRPPEKADFASDYLMGRAILSGNNPYVPLNILGEQFGISTQFTHPSPHPPSFAILIAPLAVFSFKWAYLITLVVGLICLVSSFRQFLPNNNLGLLLAVTASIAWPPVWANLYLGQSMLAQLLLLILAWQSLNDRRDIIAGALLGLVISIKLI